MRHIKEDFITEAFQDMISTIDDICALPEEQRTELIDGHIYDMAPPYDRHQKLVME